MHGLALCSLDSTALARRLHDLAGDERMVQVDFLLHLDEFDRRQEYLPLGFGSLWDFCLRELHLREGAAGRRIAAMRALRRFPRLESPLRDGRLCLSTAPLLAQVLTEENLDDLVARAAFRTKAEVEHLVATIQPRAAPRDGLRRLPQAMALSLAQSPASTEAAPSLLALGIEGTRRPDDTPATAALTVPGAAAYTPAAPARASAPAAELHAVSGDEWSLRVTIDGALKADLESLASLLSHKVRRNDYAAVLREAVRCGIEKHGKRRGAVPPSRKRTKPAALLEAKVSDPSRSIPAEVKRAVHERDGGRCAWVSKDGRRCGSRWQLEFDHVEPLSRGGKSTVGNVRLACRCHNFFHAEETHGREHMARFRRRGRDGTQTGELTIASGSNSKCNPPVAPGGGSTHADRRRAPAPPRAEPRLPFSGG